MPTLEVRNEEGKLLAPQLKELLDVESYRLMEGVCNRRTWFDLWR
jgi:hypothetical protein